MVWGSWRLCHGRFDFLTGFGVAEESGLRRKGTAVENSELGRRVGWRARVSWIWRANVSLAVVGRVKRRFVAVEKGGS